MSPVSPAELKAERDEGLWASPSREGRRSLSAFFLSGMLTSFLGAILPVWGYHLRPAFTTVGLYFLCVNLGILISVRAAQFFLLRRGVRFALMLACGIASAAFLLLAVSAPPAFAVWRCFGLFWIGFSAGVLNASVFQAISPLYQHDRASTVNLAGALFGSGCLLTALLVAGTFYVNPPASILLLFAAIPAVFLGLYAKARFSALPDIRPLQMRRALEDFKNPGAILFSVLLFVQFGNEWSIAGWLPLFLIRRLGISPESSLVLLALFWAALLVGRIAAQVTLKRVSHARLLMGSTLSALLGCAILDTTTNRFGAVMGVLFVGCGFASIYPLVVEKIGNRFPYYHPAFYNGIFSLAFTGGLLAPWLLGYLAAAWGIQAVMAVPLAGTCVVFALLLLIMLEAKLTGAGQSA